MREELGPKIYVGKRSQKRNKSDKERWCHSNRLDWYAVPSSGQKKKKKVVLRKNVLSLNCLHSRICIRRNQLGGYVGKRLALDVLLRFGSWKLDKIPSFACTLTA